MSDQFWYLATPYSKYRDGITFAYREACRAAAFVLQQQNRRVFSPIAHSHGIATYGGIDAFDHAFWMQHCRPFMESACGLIVVKMLGWDESRGIAEEIQAFEAMCKPVEFLEWPLG